MVLMAVTPRAPRVKRWMWTTPADDPDAVPQVHEVLIDPSGPDAHNPDFLASPPWDDQPAVAEQLKPLAHAPFAPSSPVLRLPKVVADHLGMKRKGRIAFFAAPDGSVVMRRG